MNSVREIVPHRRGQSKDAFVATRFERGAPVGSNCGSGDYFVGGEVCVKLGPGVQIQGCCTLQIAEAPDAGAESSGMAKRQFRRVLGASGKVCELPRPTLRAALPSDPRQRRVRHEPRWPPLFDQPAHPSHRCNAQRPDPARVADRKSCAIFALLGRQSLIEDSCAGHRCHPKMKPDSSRTVGRGARNP